MLQKQNSINKKGERGLTLPHLVALLGAATRLTEELLRRIITLSFLVSTLKVQLL